MVSSSRVPRCACAALAQFPLGTHDELIAAHGKYYQLYTGNQIEAE